MTDEMNIIGVTMTSTDRHIGRRIRQRRRAAGFTEEGLASALGVGRSTIEAYEHATERVTPEHLIEIAKVLGVSISYFFPTRPCPSS